MDSGIDPGGCRGADLTPLFKNGKEQMKKLLTSWVDVSGRGNVGI